MGTLPALLAIQLYKQQDIPGSEVGAVDVNPACLPNLLCFLKFHPNNILKSFCSFKMLFSFFFFQGFQHPFFFVVVLLPTLSLLGDIQASGSGRTRRDAAARAMKGWHSLRFLGNGEVSSPIIKVC